MSPDTDPVLFIRKDRILRIVFNHEKRVNPMSRAMSSALIDAVDTINQDADVDAVVLYGGAGRSFSAGGDAAGIGSLVTDQDIADYLHQVIDTYVALLAIEKPLVAAIDGYCIGMGLQVAMMCDYRLGSYQSNYSMPELRKGVACPLGGLLLEHFLGRARMLKLLYECDMYDAGFAVQVGLIDQLCDSDDILALAIDKARQFSRYPKEPARLTKQIQNRRLTGLIEDLRPQAVAAHVASLRYSENFGAMKEKPEPAKHPDLPPCPWSTLGEMIAANAERFASAEALVDGDARFTYQALNREAERCASALVQSGLHAGDRVAVWSRNCWQWVVVAMACWKNGMVLVPVSDRLRPLEITPLLAGSRARCLFAGEQRGRSLLLDLDESIESRNTRYPALLPHLLRRVSLNGDAGQGGRALGWTDFLALAEAPSAGYRHDTRPDDLCEILFTSGTTGKPKGVSHSHRQVLNSFWGACHIMASGKPERRLVIPPFSHIYGLHSGIVQCLQMGACLVVSTDTAAGKIADKIIEENITAMAGPPSLFSNLLMEYQNGNNALKNLDFVTTGGAPVPEALVSGLKVAGVDFVQQVYGLCECCPVTATGRYDPDELISGTLGMPMPGIEIRICDDDGNELEAGEAGNILVRGPGLMLGYDGDAEQTAAALHDGWLITGDAGALDERGRLVLKGRKKEMYISHGFNVYPAEIEQLLLQSNLVSDAAVVSQPCRLAGESGVAFVIAEQGVDFEIRALKDWARANLANYKCPVKFIEMEKFPVNASGKVDKKILLESLQ